MKKKRFGRKLATVAAIAVLAVVAGAAYVAHTPASPFDGKTDVDTASARLIQRGEYVARASDCVACHSVPDAAPFSGGLAMATPLGTIYTTNITPDKTTGIGAYSLADFDRAMRHGVARDGHRLYPAMPYPSYVKLSDDDVQALYAYFMHGVQPAHRENRPGGIEWPLNMRWPLAVWNAVFAPSETYRPKPPPAPVQDADKGTLWNRGAYLVQAAGHCGSCHTPRGFAMNERAFDESSPLYVSGALLDGWYAPSLRNDPNTGLGRWSEEDVQQFLKTGRNRHAVVYGSMTDVVNNSTQFMSDEDLKAIAHYLKSLPGAPERDGPPWKYDASSTASLAVGERLKVPGAQTFAARCSACHGIDGRGQAPWIPPLAGAVSSMSKENASSINITLNGSGRVVANGTPDAYRMPPFRNQLSDKEIADVLTFVRTAWGNQGGAVAQSAVKDLRDRTDPASSEVIILQMR
ncbi:c-type cytochrome [Achromobacter aloeverae]|uniref:Alcohol dehydrogenase n=1 Tax=Achromobacter aloeverae TaxID=1750518 RepID=A0A4Q1HF36_9BURK|nr:cytochrome c [Achromobacter aloeverae]RXN85219.1 alcohol dehydrogenase [Achromobacter aloeverae]